MMAFLGSPKSCLDNNLTMKYRFLVGKGKIRMLNHLPERLLKERDHYGSYSLLQLRPKAQKKKGSALPG